MSLEKELQARSESKCELCGATENLGIYLVPPTPSETVDGAVFTRKPLIPIIGDA